MSVQKMMFVSAVPFHLARLQSGASKSLVLKAGGVGMTSKDNNDLISFPNVRTIAKQLSANENTNFSRITKKRNKMFKNKFAARVSREKAKLQTDLLEKELLDLKVEKMKLLFENEELKMQYNSLEEENLSLKRKLGSPKSHFQGNDSFGMEVALKHASFVNVPQPKEWVLPHLFILLIMALGEVLNSLQVKPVFPFQASNICQILSRCMKSVASIKNMMVQTMCLSVLYHTT